MSRDRSLAVSLVFLAVLASGGHARAAAQDAIRIGVQLPLSGERAPIGQMIRAGIEMAVEAVNARGGVDGVPLTLTYEDSRNSAEGAVEAARKLVQEHQVAAIIGELFSPFVMASRDLIERAGVPYVIGGTSPRTTENARWIFRAGASDTLLAALIARYVIEDLKLTSLAVLSSGMGIHNGRAELLLKVLKARYGITPAVRETWKPDDREFALQLQKVKAASVQAIIALGETGEGAPFLRQVKALGLGALVIGHRDFGAPSVLDEAGEAAEGVRIVTEYMPSLMSAERQAWAKAFRDRHRTEASIITAQYHDAVLVLAEAMKLAGPGREQIRAGLERLRKFPGVMADYTFDAGHDGVHRFYVARITGGKPVLETVLEAAP